ncbi:MAG: HD domain-containing protein [Chloroflexi bacterium]|nr:MAG: HD domain-containing protein [Chloroflexota bacterium]
MYTNKNIAASKGPRSAEFGFGTFREGRGSRVATIQYDRERESRAILLSFVKSIQERDIVTYEHSRRVATYAQRLARYLGWSRCEAYDLALAALVHAPR